MNVSTAVNESGWRRLGAAAVILWLLGYCTYAGYDFYGLLSKRTVLVSHDGVTMPEVIFSSEQAQKLSETELLGRVKRVLSPFLEADRRTWPASIVTPYDEYVERSWKPLAVRHSIVALTSTALLGVAIYLALWVRLGFTQERRATLSNVPGVRESASKHEKPVDYAASGEAAELRDVTMPLIQRYFSKLLGGNYGLATTYWIATVMPALAMGLLAENLSPGKSLVLVLLIGTAYHVCALVGVWRSAGKYSGPAIWRWLARLSAGFGLAVGVPLNVLVLVALLPNVGAA